MNLQIVIFLFNAYFCLSSFSLSLRPRNTVNSVSKQRRFIVPSKALNLDEIHLMRSKVLVEKEIHRNGDVIISNLSGILQDLYERNLIQSSDVFGMYCSHMERVKLLHLSSFRVKAEWIKKIPYWGTTIQSISKNRVMNHCEKVMRRSMPKLLMKDSIVKPYQGLLEDLECDLNEEIRQVKNGAKYGLINSQSSIGNVEWKTVGKWIVTQAMLLMMNILQNEYNRRMTVYQAEKRLSLFPVIPLL